jgi:hypothetical protein
VLLLIGAEAGASACILCDRPDRLPLSRAVAPIRPVHKSPSAPSGESWLPTAISTVKFAVPPLMPHWRGQAWRFCAFPRDTCPFHKPPRGHFHRARDRLQRLSPCGQLPASLPKSVVGLPRRLWTLPAHVLLKVVTRTRTRCRQLTRARVRPHASLVDLTPRMGTPSAAIAPGFLFALLVSRGLGRCHIRRCASSRLLPHAELDDPANR